MHPISVKELRTKFPFVRSELKKGTTFLIIHKSKPIGQLVPMNEGISEEATLEEIEQTIANDWARMYPPLTKEEDDYYMSLAPKTSHKK